MAIVETPPPPTESDPPLCTVIFGHSSFVGRALVAALLDAGHRTVRIADPLPPPDPIRSDPDGAVHLQVDVTDRAALRSAVAGAATVFHLDPVPVVPSPSPPVASDEDFARLHSLAIVGTKNLLAACREEGVRHLIYVGSADVVFDGKHDVRDADESLPYPDKYEDVLNELRMQTEILVLRANGKDGLLTCALRPSNVFGPEDPSFMSFLVNEARAGRAKLVIGSGKNVCDLTYVKNVVHAILSAEHALCSEKSLVAGKPLFITNNEPIELWEFISSTLEGFGYSRPMIHLPVKLALLIVFLIRIATEKLGLRNPNVSPAIIYILSCTRTYNSSRAKQLIGYSPIVSIQDGIRLTMESFSPSGKGLYHSREKNVMCMSKADKLLGGGVVADLLLWRDEKKTFGLLFALFVLFYWFVLSERTFISSTAKILMMASFTLFIHGNLPSTLYGVKLEKISSSCFQTSESTVRQSCLKLASSWNRGIRALKSVAKGDDWNIFLKVAGSLYLVKMLLSIPFSILIGVGLTLMFIIFIVYEQYEDEVDKIKDAAVIALGALKEQLMLKLAKIFAVDVRK